MARQKKKKKKKKKKNVAPKIHSEKVLEAERV